MGVTLALAIPFLAPFPWIFDMLLPTAKSLFSPAFLSPYADYPRIIPTYGYLPILLCLVGTLVLSMRGDKRSYSLVLGLLTVLLMLVTFFALHYGVLRMYERGLMYLMLMMGIVAGAGLMGVRKLRLPEKTSIRLKASFITQNMGQILCLTLVVLTLAIAIPHRQSIPYYHMIDEHDYDAFVWIRDNVNESYEKAILDPWKATAFTAITRKHVYTRIHEYPTTKDEETYEFLHGGCTDTTLLRENEISIVYTRQPCDNPDLLEVRKYVYLLRESGTP